MVLKRSKTGLIKARCSSEMKEQLVAAAAERGESEAVLVREAISRYLSQLSRKQILVLRGKQPKRGAGYLSPGEHQERSEAE
jgi:hypothetical protein